MFSQKNSLYIDEVPSRSIILRKNFRLNSSKLPSDFFIRQISRYQPKRVSLKKSYGKQSAKENTRETFTPSFEREEQLSPVKDLMSQRKIGTARVNMINNEDLIHQVIRSARKIRGVLRQKSLDVVSRSMHRQEIQLRLPQIKKSKQINLLL